MKIPFRTFDLSIPDLSNEDIIGEGHDGTVYKIDEYEFVAKEDLVLPNMTAPIILKKFRENLSTVLLLQEDTRDTIPSEFIQKHRFSAKVYDLLKHEKIPTYDFFELSERMDFAVMPFLENVYSAQDFDTDKKRVKKMHTVCSLKDTYRQCLTIIERMTANNLLFTRHAEFIKVTEKNGLLSNVEVVIGDLANIKKASDIWPIEFEDNLSSFLFSFLHTYFSLVDNESFVYGLRELLVLDVAVTHSHIPELSSFIHEIISQFYMDLLHKKMHESPEIFWNIIKDSFSILGKEIHRCEQLDNAILMLAEVIGSINMSNQDGMKKNILIK